MFSSVNMMFCTTNLILTLNRAARLATAKQELRSEIKEVEMDGEATFDAVQLLAVAMARVEEQLKAANDKLDRLAR